MRDGESKKERKKRRVERRKKKDSRECPMVIFQLVLLRAHKLRIFVGEYYSIRTILNI